MFSLADLFRQGSSQQMPQPGVQQGGLAGLLNGFSGEALRTNLGDILSPEVALPMAGAMIAGETPAQSFGGAFALGGQALGARRAERKATAEQNKTVAAIKKLRPDLAGYLDAGAPVGEVWKMVLGGGDGAKPTDDMREYQKAVEQGFQGTMMEYLIKMKEAGRSQVNIDTGVKLPGGYEWVDPNNQSLGVRPIKGGPATQMPAELAARVGMADSFLGQLDGIKERVKTGEVTGVWDRTKAVAGYGSGGQTYRQIQSGVDALMRLLTGAGMNQTEAEQYAQRYLPTYMDDTETMLQKLDQLARELNAAKGMATRGRGDQNAVPAPALEDPLGIR